MKGSSGRGRSEKKTREERRESILDAVEQVLSEGEKLTLDAIARASGVSRVTLYQYFSGKQELLEAATKERGVAIEGLEQPGVEERILRAARQVFSRQGFRAATMEEVAQEAGVGTVTVYRRFTDKAGLIQAFAEHVRPSSASGDLELSTDQDLEETLALFAARVMQTLSHNKDLFRLMLLEAQEIPDVLLELRQKPGRTHTRLASFFEEHQKLGHLEGSSPSEMATAFMGMMFSFSFLRPILEGKSTQDFERSGALLARLFVRGLATSDKSK